MDKANDNDSSNKNSGPSSPTPSVSCETCSQLSQLEVEAFAAIREVASFVRSICISEVLTRTSELLFLNLVTFENENYCIELTQKGWRICSDRLDCMYGDFRKLDMHVQYYDSIYALLDSLSKQYRERFGADLTQRLDALKNKKKEENEETDNQNSNGSGRRQDENKDGNQNKSRNHSVENCPAAIAQQQQRRQTCSSSDCPVGKNKTSSSISALTQNNPEEDGQRREDETKQN